MFDITDEAETYIAKLFEDQDETDLALKVDVEGWNSSCCGDF